MEGLIVILRKICGKLDGIDIWVGYGKWNRNQMTLIKCDQIIRLTCQEKEVILAHRSCLRK